MARQNTEIALRKQVRWAFKKGCTLSNYTAHIVSEYGMRTTLTKLGYQFKAEDISYKRAICFSVIAGEISKINSDEMERQKALAKAKSKGRR